MERNESCLRQERPLGQHYLHQHSQRGLRRRRREGPEKICEEATAENFPHVGKEIVNQVQEAESAPRRINPRRSPPRPIVIKGTKIKDKVNKTQSNKGSRADNTQGNSPQAISWFLHRNSASQKESAGCVYSEERKILQSGTLEPARLLQS